MAAANSNLKARSALSGAYFFWGISIVANKIALSTMPFFLVGLIRFGAATGVVGRKSLVSLLSIRGPKVRLLVLHGVLSVVNMCSFFIAINQIDGSLFSLINLLLPLVIYNFSVGFLHEKSDKHLLIGSLIAFTGSILAVATSEGIIGSANLIAILAAGANIFSDAGLTVINKKLSKTMPRDQISGLYHGANFIFFGITTILFHNQLDFASISLSSWIATAWATVFSTILCWNLYLYGLKRVRGTELSLFVYITPIVGIVTSILFLDETTSWLFWVGAGIVALGIVYAERLMKLRVPNLFEHRLHHHN